MAKLVQQSTASDPLFFFLTASSDHITGLTGATPTVTICKNGAAFAAPSGAVTEIANGWYQVAGNATDTNTLGDILLHATATSADPCDLVAAQVVAFNPRSATNLGLSALPTANPGASNGLLIDGSNAATVTFADGLVINRSTANSDALQLNGSGSGNGLKATGGAASGATAAGDGALFAGGAASTTAGGVAGVGFQATGGAGAATTNGAAAGLAATAGGTTTVSGNDGMVVTGTGNGNGLTAAHAGTGKDLNATTSPPLQVNATQINGVSTASVTTVNANQGTTQPINFTGTGASALVQADTRDIAGAAVSTTAAQIGVNMVNIAGAAAAIDANNLLKVDMEDVGGTALGAHASGMVPADLRDIAGSAVSTTSAQLGVNVVDYAGAAAAVDANNLPKVDIEAINTNTTAAQNVAHANQAIGRGTCTTGGSTTSIPTSTWSPGGAGIASGQFIGRTVIFDADTATASLQGQATTITANTASATPTFTVTALTTAPASGDTFGVY